MKLETERLILRELNRKDINDIVEGINNLEVSKWLAYAPYPYTKKDAIKFIEKSEKDFKQKERTRFSFAIELKSEGKVIGVVNLDKIDKIHGTAGGGMWLNKNYQGKGYGSEAFGERIRFAFEDLKLRRLNNGFFKGNKASWKMQKRFGYKKEGIRRDAYKCMATGKIVDEYLTGLLKKEWKK